MSRYKVWVEIEKLTDGGDVDQRGGDMGVLPDCVGSFKTLRQATERQAVIAAHFGIDPENSDAVAAKGKRRAQEKRKQEDLVLAGPNPFCLYNKPLKSVATKAIKTVLRDYAAGKIGGSEGGHKLAAIEKSMPRLGMGDTASRDMMVAFVEREYGRRGTPARRKALAQEVVSQFVAASIS